MVDYKSIRTIKIRDFYPDPNKTHVLYMDSNVLDPLNMEFNVLEPFKYIINKSNKIHTYLRMLAVFGLTTHAYTLYSHLFSVVFEGDLTW